MNHAVRAVVALALGVGLAVAAQAHGTDQQGAAPTMQRHAALTGQMQRDSATKLSRQQIREAQQQLKSADFYKGAINGVMNHRTHLAIARFQQHNALPRTATLDRKTLDRLSGSQGVGVGSSMPMQEKPVQGSSKPTTLKGTESGSATTPITPPATPGAGSSTGTTDQGKKY